MVKDVLIVGAGPTGLYAWKTAQDFGLTGTVIEANDQYGGQTQLSYPEKTIYNLPGFPQIKGKELVENMYAAINQDNHDWNLMLSTKIIDIKTIKPDEDKYTNWFEVTLNNKETLQFKYILLCEGIGVYEPFRIVEEEIPNVHYSVSNLDDFKNKDLVIFGGGDSALDWANELSGIAKHISVIHRRDEFRAKDGSLEKAHSNNVELITPFHFKDFEFADNKHVNKILLENSEDESITKEVKADVILVQFGQKITKNQYDGVSISRNKLNRIEVDETMQSSIPGVFAAGDSIVYEGKLRNLLYGFKESVTALVNIEKTVHDRKIINNGW